MDNYEDWAEEKEQEKNDRYSSHLGFINHLSKHEKSGWKATNDCSKEEARATTLCRAWPAQEAAVTPTGISQCSLDTVKRVFPC